MNCCPHDERDHSVANTCHEQIHYPNEDYPCLCEGFAPLPDQPGVCGNCAHKKEAHEDIRICRPASGEVCGCQRPA